MALMGKYLDEKHNMDLADCTTGSNCTARCNDAYVNGSILCGQCAYNYSHEGLTGRCDKCPVLGENILFSILGFLSGIVGVLIYIQLTLSDGGHLDESDGAKSIGLSFVQLISLLVTFPIAWPPIFVSIFKIGGAITVLGQHLMNLKCMFLDMSDGDVFFSTQLLWGLAPPIILIVCVATWLVVDRTKTVIDLEIKIKTSCVALMYLVWPSLCSQTFSLFACRSVCNDDTLFLRVDLDVPCWEGQHAVYAFALGLPMLVIYVIGLPVAALTQVWKMHRDELINVDDERVYGMFYTAFRKETWWWEGTIAARKIVIALIGVFGADMADMQVHLTAMLVFLIVLITSQVRPFGGLKHGILHVLEMGSLMATFLTLWAGSVFNSRPKCEDPLKGEGSTLPWCNALSIIVGLVDILVLAAIMICFVYIKAIAYGGGPSEDDDDIAVSGDSGDDAEMVFYDNPFEKNRVKAELVKARKIKRHERMKVVRKKLAVGARRNPLVNNVEVGKSLELTNWSGKEKKTEDIEGVGEDGPEEEGTCSISVDESETKTDDTGGNPLVADGGGRERCRMESHL